MLLGLVVGIVIYLGYGILTAPDPQDAPGWSRLADMPEPRGETAIATTADGRLFVLGGLTGATFETSRTVSILDPRTGTWSAGPPLPAPRHHAAAVAVGDSVYVSGGGSSIAGGAPRPEMWVLDPDSEAWRPLAPMPNGRLGHRMAALDGKVHVVGGVPGPEERDPRSFSVITYDPAADSWAWGGWLLMPRDHLGVVVVDGEIWAIGGRSILDGRNHVEVEIYDPAETTWRMGLSLPEATSGAAEAAIGGHILVSGGEDPASGRIVDRHWILDTTAARPEWVALAPPPLSVHGAPGATVDGRFVIAGGASRAGGQSNTAWSGLTQVLLELP